MSTLSFSHSLAYLCEKVKQPLSIQAKKELYDVVETAAGNSKPTIRQLFNGLVAVRMVSHGSQVTASDVSYQMSLLISLSNLSYMIPQGPLLNHEKMLNSIVRMMKDEIQEKDSGTLDLNLDGYKHADPWKLGLCCLYLVKIVSSNTLEWAEYSNVAFKNIHNVYLAAFKLSATDQEWSICLLLALIAKVDLALHLSKMPKKNEYNERNYEFMLNLTLHSLFEVVERIEKDDSQLLIYLGLVAIESTQKLLSFEESVWKDLSDSRQMDLIQKISKKVTVLTELYLNNSDLWLLISRLFLILMTTNGFRILLLLPDTTLCLLQLAMDRINVTSARFERQTWLPFIFKFCLFINYKYPKINHNLEQYQWINSSSNDQVERMKDLFLDIYSDKYNEWYEAICNILYTSMDMYLN